MIFGEKGLRPTSDAKLPPSGLESYESGVYYPHIKERDIKEILFEIQTGRILFRPVVIGMILKKIAELEDEEDARMVETAIQQLGSKEGRREGIRIIEEFVQKIQNPQEIAVRDFNIRVQSVGKGFSLQEIDEIIEGDRASLEKLMETFRDLAFLELSNLGGEIERIQIGIRIKSNFTGRLAFPPELEN